MAQKEIDGTPIDERVYRAFESNYRKYARFATENDAGFVVIPTYDRRLDNSLGMSTSQAMDALTEHWEEKSGNLIVKNSKRPPREEAEAFATRLPDLKIASYGYLHSAEVVKVIDDNEMIVRELWLVNREELSRQYNADKQRMARRNDGDVDEAELQFDYAKRAAMVTQQEDRKAGFKNEFRLVGYDTRGLRVGERWEGPNSEGFQVGVVKWETPEPGEDDRQRFRARDEQRLVLTKLEDAMRDTLDEEGFKRLLAERGMTVAGFVDLVRTMRERDRENAEQRIVNALLPPERTDD
ncbi:MAG: hypothetical protein ACE37H_17605 [Phycisphaeraceae bacterium]